MDMSIASMALQLSNNGIGARDADTAGGLLLLGVGDLAVVNDDGVAGSAGTESPAESRRELGLVIGSEDLCREKYNG